MTKQRQFGTECYLDEADHEYGALPEFFDQSSGRTIFVSSAYQKPFRVFVQWCWQTLWWVKKPFAAQKCWENLVSDEQHQNEQLKRVRYEIKAPHCIIFVLILKLLERFSALPNVQPNLGLEVQFWDSTKFWCLVDLGSKITDIVIFHAIAVKFSSRGFSTTQITYMVEFCQFFRY